MRVLVVADEEPIASAIERGLIKIGYAVDVAYDGVEALEKASVNNYDVVCLDLNLPRMDGIEVCRRLREDRFSGGIIMLTARSAIRDRIEGLDEGADDYLVKPFAFSELAARIRAVTRREGGLREPIINTRGLELDPNTNRVKRDGKDIHLTPKEFSLLSVLVRNAGRVIQRQDLVTEAWGPEYADMLESLKLYVHYLRQKIEQNPQRPKYILTSRGVGYRFANV